MKKLAHLLCIIFLSIYITACINVEQSRTVPTKGIYGYLKNAPTNDGDVYIYAVPYIPNTDGSGGTFLLQKAVYPKSIVATDGFFSIEDLSLLTSMDFAILIMSSDARDTGDVLYNTNNQLALIDLKQYQTTNVLELGDLSVATSEVNHDNGN